MENEVSLNAPIIISTPNGNKEIGTDSLRIPKEHLKYNLDVSLRSESKIPFLNAKNESFYTEIKMKNPIQIIWMIRKLEPINYITRRLKETAYRMNIQLEWKCSKYFDLISDEKEGSILLYKGDKIPKDQFPSSVLPRFGSTLDKHAISILRHLENAGAIIINNCESLEISSDKFSCLQIWASQRLPIPKTFLLNFPINSKLIEGTFEFPILIKRSTGSQGKGIMKIDCPEALQDLSGLIDQNHTLLIQEFISTSFGRDVRILIVGGKIVGGMMRVATSGYKSNFHQGGYVKKVEINEELSNLALKVAKLINLQICGVDFLLGEKGYKICEINASPGFEGFELSTGIDVAKEMLEYCLKCGENGRKFE